MLLNEVARRPYDIDVCYTVVPEDIAKSDPDEPVDVYEEEKMELRKLTTKRKDMQEMFPFSYC